ncbi:MAG: spermidine/putrescine ABC transporter substrate-binding protein, partial [Spirochaetia bacterium]|nr:spermidine/putrescine ABC transporter substrate-binding protein [Spirochaetia bacterium]
GDYIDETVLADFEAQTGIAVNYETFATNEDMYIKVKQGGTRYDVIVPSDYMIARLIAEGMLEKIDAGKIPTYANIGKRYLGLGFDPTNEYSVPYMWGTFGILYNAKMVDEPVESWSIMWNPKYKKQILMMDSVRDSLAVAFLLLGYSLNTTDRAELEAAGKLLAEQKPLVLAYVGDNGKDMMAQEEAALAMSWSGDAVAVREQNPDLHYVIPKEGTNLWVDSMVIPKNSEHKKEALLFIDFMNRPEIAKKNVEYIGYATPNMAAYGLLDEETRSDPAAYPPDEALARWDVFVDIGEANAEYNRVWTEIKSR